MDYIREKFFEVVIPETHVAVDEQVVPFKGASSLKRYLPKKPKKWGYKLWALAGVSGYVFTFEVDGENRKSGPPDGWDNSTKFADRFCMTRRIYIKNISNIVAVLTLSSPRPHARFLENSCVLSLRAGSVAGRSVSSIHMQYARRKFTDRFIVWKKCPRG